jgi:hypothetical protein
LLPLGFPLIAVRVLLIPVQKGTGDTCESAPFLLHLHPLTPEFLDLISSPFSPFPPPQNARRREDLRPPRRTQPHLPRLDPQPSNAIMFHVLSRPPHPFSLPSDASRSGSYRLCAYFESGVRLSIQIHRVCAGTDLLSLIRFRG